MYWYEDDVKNAELEKNKLTYNPKMIFYGSSSIRLWDGLYKDFEHYYPLNLAFGGSTLAACNFYFGRLLLPWQPDHLVLYAGDNDLGDGASPQAVCALFDQFIQLMQKFLPAVDFSFISIKPSIARWDIISEIRTTNQLIRNHLVTNAPGNYFFVNVFDNMLGEDGLPIANLFEPDGLHLSTNGYQVWKDILLAHFSKNLKDSITQE